jgi:hypothetical protein
MPIEYDLPLYSTWKILTEPPEDWRPTFSGILFWKYDDKGKDGKIWLCRLCGKILITQPDAEKHCSKGTPCEFKKK